MSILTQPHIGQKSTACFVGANQKDVDRNFRFMSSVLPDLKKSDVRRVVIEHEASHCRYFRQALHLTFGPNHGYLLAEEARADAEAYLTVFPKATPYAQEVLRAIILRRFYDGLRIDVDHSGIFFILEFIDQRDASFSNSLSKLAKINFDSSRYESFFAEMTGAIGAGEDGGAEQECSWKEVVSKAPAYLKPYIPSLLELRSIGKLVWKKDNWRDASPYQIWLRN